jgi:hypothetical protein
VEASRLLDRREKKNMQDDYSCQVSPPKSDQIDSDLGDIGDIIDAEDENTDSPYTVIETELREVMTQGEIEIMTTLFPKASKTLASVLRKRPH